VSHSITVIALDKTHDKDPSQPHGDLHFFVALSQMPEGSLGFCVKKATTFLEITFFTLLV